MQEDPSVAGPRGPGRDRRGESGVGESEPLSSPPSLSQPPCTLGLGTPRRCGDPNLGTATRLSHFGQRQLIPAANSGALTLALHEGHRNVIFILIPSRFEFSLGRFTDFSPTRIDRFADRSQANSFAGSGQFSEGIGQFLQLGLKMQRTGPLQEQRRGMPNGCDSRAACPVEAPLPNDVELCRIVT